MLTTRIGAGLHRQERTWPEFENQKAARLSDDDDEKSLVPDPRTESGSYAVMGPIFEVRRQKGTLLKVYSQTDGQAADTRSAGTYVGYHRPLLFLNKFRQGGHAGPSNRRAYIAIWPRWYSSCATPWCIPRQTGGRLPLNCRMCCSMPISPSVGMRFLRHQRASASAREQFGLRRPFRRSAHVLLA
jgi:hypothetical protein